MSKPLLWAAIGGTAVLIVAVVLGGIWFMREQRPAGKRAGGAGFAQPGGPGDDHVAGVREEAERAELEEGAAVEAAGRAQVDLLDRGLHPQLGGLQPARQAALLARRMLALDHEAEALGEAELGVTGARRLLGERFGHRPEPEVVEALDRECVVHLLPFVLAGQS